MKTGSTCVQTHACPSTNAEFSLQIIGRGGGASVQKRHQKRSELGRAFGTRQAGITRNRAELNEQMNRTSSYNGIGEAGRQAIRMGVRLGCIRAEACVRTYIQYLY